MNKLRSFFFILFKNLFFGNIIDKYEEIINDFTQDEFNSIYKNTIIVYTPIKLFIFYIRLIKNKNLKIHDYINWLFSDFKSSENFGTTFYNSYFICELIGKLVFRLYIIISLMILITIHIFFFIIYFNVNIIIILSLIIMKLIVFILLLLINSLYIIFLITSFRTQRYLKKTKKVCLEGLKEIIVNKLYKQKDRDLVMNADLAYLRKINFFKLELRNTELTNTNIYNIIQYLIALLLFCIALFLFLIIIMY